MRSFPEPEPEPEPEPAVVEEVHVRAPHVTGWRRNPKEKVEVLASLPTTSEIHPIVAVRQGHVVGTSFHPELTGDVRMHRWWLGEVVRVITAKRQVRSGKDV